MKASFKKVPGKYLISLLAVSILIASLVAVWASNPTTPRTMSSGVFPGAPSYTVFVDGGTYYATDQHGVIASSSTSASTVFQAVSNALAAITDGEFGAATVQITAGSFPVSFTTHSFITWVGAGKESTFLVPVGSSDVVSNADASNSFITFKDLTIGPSTSGTHVGRNGITLTSCVNCHFNNIRVWYMANIGVSLSAGYQFYFENQVQIDHNGAQGLYASNTVENGIHFDNSVAEVNGQENIDILGGSAHKITNSHFELGGGVASIRLSGYFSTIDNNYFNGPQVSGTYGIYANGQGNTIANNVFRYTNGTTIVIENGEADTITGNTAFGGVGDLISLTGASYNATITGNSGENMTGGITIGGTSDRCTITGNNLGLRTIVLSTNTNSVVGNIVGAPMTITGSDNIFSSNPGFRTHNAVEATISSPYTSVRHYLAGTPTSIQITPEANPTGIAYWCPVSGLNSTYANINCTGTLDVWIVFDYQP